MELRNYEENQRVASQQQQQQHSATAVDSRQQAMAIIPVCH